MIRPTSAPIVFDKTDTLALGKLKAQVPAVKKAIQKAPEPTETDPTKWISHRKNLGDMFCHHMVNGKKCNSLSQRGDIPNRCKKHGGGYATRCSHIVVENGNVRECGLVTSRRQKICAEHAKNIKCMSIDSESKLPCTAKPVCGTRYCQAHGGFIQCEYIGYGSQRCPKGIWYGSYKFCLEHR